MNDFLDSLTSLQTNTIEKLRQALRGSHYTDIKVRTGGKDLMFEGDWLPRALDRVCDPNQNWKTAFLFLADLIDKNRTRYLSETGGAVGELLDYHMRKTRELLFAEVNGGLDEEYEADATRVRDCEMQAVRSTGEPNSSV